MHSDIKHIRIQITGKVQGVSFRVSAKAKADELGLGGFVQNEPDGSVYIEAEGYDKTLEKFINWCREGPQLAEVESVDTESAKLRHFNSFRIV